MLKFFAALFLLSGSWALLGQASPTATRLLEGQVGGTYLNGYADYTLSRFNGFGAYADADFRHGLGVEAEYHYITDADPNYLLYERSYEVGVRYSRHYKRFQPYGKLMVGRGTFNFLKDNDTYNLYAFGFGTDIRVWRSVNVRVEDEFQKWLAGSGAGAAVIPNGLSPNLPTFGVAYHFR